MNQYQRIIRQLPSRYFWDVDYHNLDVQHSKRLIIERVFTLGSLEEIRLITRFYGRAEIVKTLCHISYIDPKTLHFVSRVFRIPKRNFACYTKNALKPRFWNS